MPEKYFLDSNICLDAITDRKPFSHNAKKILLLAEKKQIEAVVSSLTFSNMFYLLSKWSSANKAYSQLSKLRRLVSIASVSEVEVDASLSSEWSDYEDAIQYYSAKAIGCQAIITRNSKDFKNSEIPIKKPDEFLKLNL